MSADELSDAPELNPALDSDVCHPASLLARLRELIGQK
jgi:hypothetical protein